MIIRTRQVREFLVTSDIIKELAGNKWGRPCRPKISSLYFFRTSYSSSSPCNLKEINHVFSETEEGWVDNTDNTKYSKWNLPWGYTAFLEHCNFRNHPLVLKNKFYVTVWSIYPEFTDTMQSITNIKADTMANFFDDFHFSIIVTCIPVLLRCASQYKK